MKIFVKTTKMEWEGMAYIAVNGDANKFRSASIGEVEKNFKDSFVILKNELDNRECAGIIKTLSPSSHDFLEEIGQIPE